MKLLELSPSLFGLLRFGSARSARSDTRSAPNFSALQNKWRMPSMTCARLPPCLLPAGTPRRDRLAAHGAPTARATRVSIIEAVPPRRAYSIQATDTGVGRTDSKRAKQHNDTATPIFFTSSFAARPSVGAEASNFVSHAFLSLRTRLKVYRSVQVQR